MALGCAGRPLPPLPPDPCAAGDGEACLRLAYRVHGDRQAEVARQACELAPEIGCRPAAELLVEHASLAEEGAAGERAFTLLARGCGAGDREACADAGAWLIEQGRCAEAPALVEDPCEARHPPSCRVAAQAHLLGCTAEPDVLEARARLEASCEAGDGRACFFAGYAALRGPPRDVEAARRAFRAGCAGDAHCDDVWASRLDDGPRSLALVKERSPVVVDHVASTSPEPGAELRWSAIGPFGLGRVSVGAMGLGGGVVEEVEDGRIRFRRTEVPRMQIGWAIGGLVIVDWSPRR